MVKQSQEMLLQRAENAFLKGEYAHALRSYALILNEYPLLDEAKVGVYLSDLGLESQEEAQALFDYYQIIKDKKENAVEIIDGLLESLDHSKEKLQKLLLDPIEEQIEYSDGIRYSDFIEVVKSRGDFKQAFEDIIFSTKVVITSKEEFIAFVTQLLNEGFVEMAEGYLETSSHLFGNDQEVLALYHLIEASRDES
jgi:tetratricopeptide (TPR) repeat protein